MKFIDFAIAPNGDIWALDDAGVLWVYTNDGDWTQLPSPARRSSKDSATITPVPTVFRY